MKRLLVGSALCTLFLSGHTATRAGFIEHPAPDSGQHRESILPEQVQPEFLQPAFSEATASPAVLAAADMSSSGNQQAQIQQLQRKIQELQGARKEDISRQRDHIEQMIDLKKSERSTLSSEKYNHDSKSYARADIERSIRALDSEIYLLQSQRNSLR